MAIPALAAREFRKVLSSLGFGDPCRLPDPKSIILVLISRSDPGGYGDPLLLGTLSKWIGPSLLEITEDSVIRSNESAVSLPDTSIRSPQVPRGKGEIEYVLVVDSFEMSTSRMSCS